MNYPKKFRTSKIWSAKSSTEGAGSSGQVGAAPNCKYSYRSAKEGTMLTTVFNYEIFPRTQNIPTLRIAKSDKSNQKKKHLLTSWPGGLIWYIQKLWSSREEASGQKNNPWKQDISAHIRHLKKIKFDLIVR